MTNPVDVLANAIHAADPDLNLSAPRLAKVVAEALTDDAIVANAMAAVRGHSWTSEDVEELSNRRLHTIVRIVLGSVAGP